jgi:acylphosphatase
MWHSDSAVKGAVEVDPLLPQLSGGDMSQKAVRATVRGRVQQVGYRQACRQTARSLGLVGWVRNLDDGTVELMAQGPRDDVNSLVGWLWSGPRGAMVTGVESDNVAADPTLKDFFIYPNPGKNH